MSPWRYLEEIRHRSLATQSPVLSLQNLFISSNHPHIPLSSCCRSLLIPLIVYKHLDASFSQSKTLSQLQNRHGPLLRPRLRLLSSFKGAVLMNFDQIVERGLLFMEFQHLEDIFSTARRICALGLTLILRRSRTGTVWFYTSTSNKRAARPKLYTKSLTRGLKLMYSRLTLVRISINL